MQQILADTSGEVEGVGRRSLTGRLDPGRIVIEEQPISKGKKNKQKEVFTEITPRLLKKELKELKEMAFVWLTGGADLTCWGGGDRFVKTGESCAAR